MKYTIEGLQQSILLEMNLDSEDAIILRYIIDFYNTGKMAKITDSGKEYFWVNYSTIIKEIPIINISSNDSLYRRFRKYVKCGLMEHYTKKNGGTFSCYRFIGNSLLKLLSNSDGTDEKSDGYGLKVGRGTDEKSEQKILLLNNTSTNNSFETFWKLYDYKKSKPKCLIKWNKIKPELYESIYEHVKKYIASTPDKKYRKHPLTYLNGECWNDEIISDDKQSKEAPVKRAADNYKNVEII